MLKKYTVEHQRKNKKGRQRNSCARFTIGKSTQYGTARGDENENISPSNAQESLNMATVEETNLTSPVTTAENQPVPETNLENVPKEEPDCSPVDPQHDLSDIELVEKPVDPRNLMMIVQPKAAPQLTPLSQLAISPFKTEFMQYKTIVRNLKLVH